MINGSHDGEEESIFHPAPPIRKKKNKEILNQRKGSTIFEDPVELRKREEDEPGLYDMLIFK